MTETSSNFFRVLGVEPELGRAFAPGEDARGANGVTVIGYGLWRDFFGGDPEVLGSTVRVNGVPLTVIGVAPRGMDYPERTSLWSAGLFRLPRGYGAVASHCRTLEAGHPHGASEDDVHEPSFVERILQRSLEFSMRLARFTPLRDQLAGPVTPGLHACCSRRFCLCCSSPAPTSRNCCFPAPTSAVRK